MARFINNSGDISQVVATRELKAFDIDELLVNSREWVDGGYADDSYAQASVAGRAGLPGGVQTRVAEVPGTARYAVVPRLPGGQ